MFLVAPAGEFVAEMATGDEGADFDVGCLSLGCHANGGVEMGATLGTGLVVPVIAGAVGFLYSGGASASELRSTWLHSP